LIVDDHRLFAEAIAQSLAAMGFADVEVVPTGRDARIAVRERCPDLVLLDIGLPDDHGIALGRDLMEGFPGMKVVALTAREDDRSVQDALRSGFDGYLTKNSEPAQFRRALESIADGQTVFPHRLVRRPGSSNGHASHDAFLAEHLTAREIEVLQLLAEGASSREIAERLGVSPNTVRTHVQGILSKLQVHSRLEAAAFAVRLDLVKRSS
jgi:DNA-binding NarL/FixJ family response regulator